MLEIEMERTPNEGPCVGCGDWEDNLLPGNKCITCYHEKEPADTEIDYYDIDD